MTHLVSSRPPGLPNQLQIELQPGAAGNLQTLEIMRQVALLRASDPAVRAKVLEIIYPVAQNDRVGEVVSIGRWVRSKMRYTLDVAGEEQLTDPLTLLDQISRGVPCTSSDCDDMSLLTITLLLAAGYGDVFLCAVKYDSSASREDSYDHVYTVVYVKDQATGETLRIPLDCILENVPMGSEVNHAAILEYAI